MEMMDIARARCVPETLVRLKHETRTTLSYAGLAIKAERLGFAARDSVTEFSGWRKLEAQRYGVPFYGLRKKSRKRKV
jgi:hypothetical protein